MAELEECVEVLEVEGLEDLVAVLRDLAETLRQLCNMVKSGLLDLRVENSP